MLHLGSFGSKLTTSLLGSVSGEQISEIFGVYVESSLMGYGSCCYHGHCPCQWRSKYPPLSFFLSFFLSFLPSNSHKFLLWKYDCVAIFFNYALLIVYRESLLTGKTLWVSLLCFLSTPPLVLSRKTMRVTLLLLSWLVLLLKPRYWMIFSLSLYF